MSQISVHSLYIYPIKSLQGIQLDSAELTSRGFAYDRHWMLVDQQGQFLSQRRCAEMALLETELLQDSLKIRSKIQSSTASPELDITLRQATGKTLKVTIWQDQCLAAEVSDEANRWFSEQLNQPCKLVYLPSSEQRAVDNQYALRQEQVGFADGFPLLVLSQSSLDLLNQKLSKPVSILQFRPNIVLTGCHAHAEDSWPAMRVNQIEIRLPKLCSRCVIPSINQLDGTRINEMNRVLAAYRRQNNHIMFGMNGLHQQNGSISRQDIVTILAA